MTEQLSIVLSGVPCAVQWILVSYLFLYVVVCVLQIVLCLLVYPSSQSPWVTMKLFSASVDSISVL